MARSLKKGPYVHYKLDKKVAENVASNKKTVSRPGLEPLRLLQILLGKQ